MAPLGPPFITDEAWAAILAAASPHVPGVEARGAIEEAARDYFGLRRPPRALRQWKANRTRYRAALAHVDRAIAALDAPPKMSDGDPAALARLLNVREYAASMIAAHDSLLSARTGRRHPGRDWLFTRLSDIWVSHFNGEPGGAVAFIMAVLEALDEQTPSHTIKNALKRLHGAASAVKPFGL